MPQDQQKDQKKTTPADQIKAGYEQFKSLADKAKKDAPKKDGPPEIDTTSVGGFLSSAGKRIKYAVYGPDEKK